MRLLVVSIAQESYLLYWTASSTYDIGPHVDAQEYCGAGVHYDIRCRILVNIQLAFFLSLVQKGVEEREVTIVLELPAIGYMLARYSNR